MEVAQAIKIPSFAIKLLKLLGFERKCNRIKAREFTIRCLHESEKIIRAVVLPTEETSFSHEVIKKYYKNASSIVGDIISKNDIEKIMQALSAARIYYWIRVFDGKNSDEIANLIKEREKRILAGAARNNSCEYVIQNFGSGEYNIQKDEEMISLLRDNCLADIAELKRLEITYIN